MSLILVTGGCGFIGSHVADALVARGDQVRVLDDLSTGRLDNLPPQAELIRGDVADPAVVARAMRGVDGCIHLAAVASVVRCAEDPVGAHATNLTGAIAVLDAARRAGGPPVVYASSAAVYGDTQRDLLDEAAPVAPKSAYGVDKLGCELHAAVFSRAGLPTLGLRLFNVYGPRQDGASPYSGVISIFVERLARGAGLLVLGGGGQTRDFVYVADVAAVMLAGLDRLRGSQALPPVMPPVLNVCTGQAVSVLTLAGTLASLHGVRPRIEHQPARAGDVAASCGDPTLLRSTLGWAPETTLAEGLARTVLQPSLAA